MNVRVEDRNAEPLEVSVVIPAYQSAAYLSATLASVFAQTHAPREVIVVDDGSTDATVSVAQAGGAHVIVQPNSGPSAARNRGIAAATSPWIAFIDSDDLWEPAALQRLCTAARLCPDLDFVFCDSVTFAQAGTLPGTDLLRYADYRAVQRTPVAPGIVRCDHASLVERFRRSMFILTSTVLVRREALLACGLFDAGLLIAEDWDLFLRLFRETSAAVVEEPLVRYRLHERNLTRDGLLNSAYQAKLAQRVIAHPERYPAGSDAYYRAAEPRRLWLGALEALRANRFTEAQAALRERQRLQPSPLHAAQVLAVTALSSRLGRALLQGIQRAWRRRPWKYRKPVKPA
jgi:glycosyltransferase involved in cell wall biosynthesis